MLLRFWQVHWAEQWQYRANTLMYLFYWLVSPIVYMSVWMSISALNGDVNGMRPADFAAYYLVALAVNILTSQISIHVFGYKIEDGTLSNWLIEPVHPMFTHTLMTNLAFKTLQVISMVPILALLIWLFQPALAISLPNLLLAVPVIVAGFALNFLIGGALTLIAFWTTRVHAIHNIYFAAYMFFAGEFVPLHLLPEGVQLLARALPFQLSLYFPVQLLLGRLTPQDILVNLALLAFWLVAAFAIFNATWRAGVRRYSAVGA
jgi:ABC-2 type transport system permease protein